jgi:fumarylpyruvate hydrolase
LDYVVPFSGVPTVPVEGTTPPFPIRRIYCVGRNYAAHAREMGHDPDREPPFFFMKPADTVAPGGGDVRYPPRTADLHHEVELVAAIGAGGSDIARGDALSHVCGYAVGIDLTRRDLQALAKGLSRPWEVGKVFDQAAPMSRIRQAEDTGHPTEARIWLAVNGEVRQDGNLSQMIWSVPEVITHLSSLFTLAPGDLIFTGTPAGVGALERGDVVKAGVEGVGELRITIV